jgi:hypothetical protein
LAAVLATTVAYLPASAGGSARTPSAPRSVKAVADTDSITVTWRSPRRSNGAGKVDKYKVIRWAPSAAKRGYRVAATKRALDITGLRAGTTYRFTVRAHNRAGWGPASPVAIATLPTTPPGPPGPPAPQPPLPGFGTIAGPCWKVAPELAKATPSLLDNRFDFAGDPFEPADLALLTPGAQTIFNTPSGGGSSTLSEVFAFETLARCEGASLLKTELEITYQDGGGERTDFLVQIGASKVGVMVTRAFRPPPTPFTQADAAELIATALDHVNQSSQNVLPADAWVKQILVVMSFDSDAAQKIRDAWLAESSATRADTIVYVVTTDGDDLALY